MVREKIVSEDDGRRCEDELQKVTDAHVKRADAALGEKEADLMEI